MKELVTDSVLTEPSGVRNVDREGFGVVMTKRATASPKNLTFRDSHAGRKGGEGTRALLQMNVLQGLASIEWRQSGRTELANRVRVQLGIGGNKQQGQWEPSWMVEHPGVEVDLKNLQPLYSILSVKAG
ncbi:hypothetical protein CYMTET_50822 [Cymbomonas tetramitiformis]|uniref:Uncharacterized protein n=1 Tax=Cymbomonas tetramitiformis TaxID=36881 RepID=A0AAE0BNH8_9CHLO|nr:hypothetical protein CYMTET_50822 [Cymbomonas tetramitiformis]